MIRGSLNVGIPGYSTDQQLLYVRDRFAGLKPDRVLLLIYLGNDILDNTLAYPLQADYAKPYFSRREDERLVLNTPIPRQRDANLRSATLHSVVFADELHQYETLFDRLTRSSRLLRRIVPASVVDANILESILARRLVEHRTLMTDLIVEFTQFASASDIGITLALLPGKSYVELPCSSSAAFQDHVRRHVTEVAAEHNLLLIDVAEEMRKTHQISESADWFHPNEGHYTAAGHRQDAKIILGHPISLQ